MDPDPGMMPEKDLRSIGVAMTMGFGIAISLAVFVFGGVWLDEQFGSAPWWTMAGLAVGLISAGYQLWELVLASRPDRENGPLGRRLQKTMSGTSARRT